MLEKISSFAKKRKLTTGIIVIAIISTTYFGIGRVRGSTTPPRYILGSVTKGTLITSISGSGQIAVSDQVEIKSKASGDLLQLTIQEGQEVKANDRLAQISATDANKAVRDAAVSLETAQLNLQKAKEPTTAYELLQAENSVASAAASLQKLTLSQGTDYQKAIQTRESASDALTKSYDDAYNTLATTFTDLPDVLGGIYTILYTQEIGASESTVGPGTLNDAAFINTISFNDSAERDRINTFIIKAKSDYLSAKATYDSAVAAYKNISRDSNPAAIEAVLTETIAATKQLADAVKNETSILDFWVEYRTIHQMTVFNKVKTYQSDIAGYTSKSGSNLSSLLGIQRTLADNKQSKLNAEQSLKALEQNAPLDLAAAKATLAERQASLENLKKGPEPLDIRSQEISVRERSNALADARQKLADYTIRAPFDGVVAKVSVKKRDTINSGTAIATLITKQRIAQISLNELDAAKVQVGQKVTLTFDAIENLSISGKVAALDTLGTVSQGVVSYNLTIVFDTQDERIKPGMSVSATIITSAKPDVLLAPSSAVKTSGGVSYVEILDTPDAAATGVQGVTSKTAPRQQNIEVGASNDTSVEIISGLSEGDQVIIRTIQTTAQASSAATAPSLFGGTGATRPTGGTGAGNIRFQGR